MQKQLKQVRKANYCCVLPANVNQSAPSQLFHGLLFEMSSMALGELGLDEIEHVSFILPAFLGILGMLHTHKKKKHFYIFTSQTPSDPIIKYTQLRKTTTF